MGANPTRFVIIGNGAAGTYAAEQLRKDDIACEIVMIDDEPYTLYWARQLCCIGQPIHPVQNRLGGQHPGLVSGVRK